MLSLTFPSSASYIFHSSLNTDLDNANTVFHVLCDTTSTTEVILETENITNYKSIIVLIYYNSSGTEYFAEMNIPISLFKAEPIAPFYPNYHNENTFYKGRVSYVNDTHVSLTAPLLHGIKVIGIK